MTDSQSHSSVVTEAKRMISRYQLAGLTTKASADEVCAALDVLVEQLDSVAQAVEALWVTRITTGETAIVNTRELTDLHKLLLPLSNPVSVHSVSKDDSDNEPPDIVTEDDFEI